MQALPGEQVFLGFGIDGMKTANTGSSLETSDRFPVCDADVNGHAGVSGAGLDEYVQVGRKIGLEIAQRQPADCHCSLIAERGGGDLARGLYRCGLVEGGGECQRCRGEAGALKPCQADRGVCETETGPLGPGLVGQGGREPVDGDFFHAVAELGTDFGPGRRSRLRGTGCGRLGFFQQGLQRE